MSWLASRRFVPTLLRIGLLGLLGLLGWFAIQSAISQPATLEREFPKTDFSKSIVDFDEIQSGGPPRDGIPALDDPDFIPAEQADWVNPEEPVIVVTVGDESRAYPLQIMIWHEIANDTINGLPLAITFCPLCNATLVFEREFDGKRLEFEMRDGEIFDTETDSRWNALGKAVSGPLEGQRLEPVTGGVHFAFAWLAFRPEISIFGQ